MIIPVCVIVFYCSYKGFKRIDLEFAEKRDVFVSYLDNINDIETLKRIGEINMFGERERWYPRYTNLLPYLEKKFDDTNDEKFETFINDYKRFIKGFLCTMPFIVLSIMIPVSIIVSLIRGQN